MKGMSLSAKIISGIAFVLLLMVVAVGMYHYSSSKAATSSENLVRLQFEAAIGAGHIEKVLLEARRSEKDFILRSDMKYAEKNDQAVQEFRDETQKVIVIVQEMAHQKMVDLANQALGYIDSYQTYFKQYVAASQKAGLNHKSGLQGEFRGAAHGIQDGVKASGDMDLLAIMLDCRKHEKDYMLRGDKKYVQKLHDSADRLRQKLVSDEDKERLTVYEKGFDALVVAYDEMDKAKALMRDAVHKIEPLAEQLLAALVDEAHVEADAVAQQTAYWARLALSIAICAIIIGFLIAFLMARGITKPILQTVDGLTVGAEQVSAAAGQVSSSSQSLAEGASEQAASLEETSASMEEIASMTKNNADNSMEADSLMKNAITIIQKADQSMDEMSISMEGISGASEETSKIVKTIDEIAFQTNLLALNAAVEAARAGEAGAGFAVVADEVRNLAMRAAEAAQNTSALIEGTVQKVANGKQIVDKTNEAFKEVAGYGHKIGSLVSEIAVASKEQATGVGQVTEAINQMDTITQQNSASSEESAAAAEELNAQAETMMDIVRGLKTIVDGQKGTRKAGSNKVKSAPQSFSPPEPKGRSAKKIAALPAAGSAQAARPASSAKSSAPSPKKEEMSPEDIIPMDDDDDFEDF